MAVYTLAQIAGAAVTGLAVAGLGSFLRTVTRWESTTLLTPLAVLAIAAGLRDLKLLPVPLPSRNWQVPQSWKRFSPTVMAACFGFGIGLGVLTRIPFASFYFLLLVCAALGSIPLGVALLALHGLARAGTVALVARGQAFALNPHKRIDTIGRLTAVVAYMDGLALALVAGLLFGQTRLLHF